MKRLTYIFMLPILALCVHSCVNEEDDLFDESAAQRMNKAVVAYGELLESSANGWVMDYYPSDGSMGGYTYTIVFKDGKASMASDLSLYSDTEEWPAGTVQKSLYQVKAEQECLLTFDTYNLIFHFWSEPRGSSSPAGYESDYEFTFKQVGNDTIQLKGKRYGNRIQLIRLQESADAYLSKVIETGEKMAHSPRATMQIGGKAYSCMLADRVFQYTVGEGEAATTESIPYVYSANGLRLYQPVTIDGTTFRYLTLEAGGDLVATEADVTFPHPTGMEILCSGYTQCMFDFNFSTGESSMCDEMYQLYESLAALPDFSNITLLSMFIGSNPAYPDFDYPYCIGWEVSLWGIFNYYVIYGVEAQPSGDSEVVFKPLGPSLNFDVFAQFQPLVDYICEHGPYQLTPDDEAFPSRLRLVSKADEKVWFELRL